MSAFSEFCLVALLLFAWESILWVPLRGVCLTRAVHSGKLRILAPDRWFSTKSSGAVFTSVVPGSGTVMPCQALPLLVDAQDRWLLQRDDGSHQVIAPPTWQDIHWQSPHLSVGGTKVKLTSARILAEFFRGKKKGLSPAESLRAAWRASTSPARARAAWRRWRIATASLRMMQPLLTVGFMSGLVMYGLDGEKFPLLIFLAWMWLTMIMIASQVWFLGDKVYRENRGEILLDAVLCAIVPFHAMRAAENVSRHAFGHLHPWAFIGQDTGSQPWLAKTIRLILHPRPGRKEDEILLDAIQPHLDFLFHRHGLTADDFIRQPVTQAGEEETHYCPRCHGLYLATADTCRDCGGMTLRELMPRND
jgi:hypothetical protein